MGDKPNRANERREELREYHWPGSRDEVWKGPKEKGYCCLPRSLPLVLHLVSEKGIVGKLNCESVYVELLALDRGQGVVQIDSEGAHAYRAGYTGPRAIRSWRERIKALAQFEFIRIASAPNQPVRVVMLRHPHIVALELHEKGLVPVSWWQSYLEFQREVGASLPKAKKPTPALNLLKIAGGSKKAGNRRR